MFSNVFNIIFMFYDTFINNLCRIISSQNKWNNIWNFFVFKMITININNNTILHINFNEIISNMTIFDWIFRTIWWMVS